MTWSSLFPVGAGATVILKGRQEVTANNTTYIIQRILYTTVYIRQCLLDATQYIIINTMSIIHRILDTIQSILESTHIILDNIYYM